MKVAAWLPPGTNIGDQSPLPKEVLNFRKRGIDAETLPLVAYGSMLFGSPYIFGETASSLGLACTTCHNGSDTNRSFYIPGISHQRGAIDVRGSFFNALFNDHRHNSVDIPSLRGLRFTGPYGRDGRFASLRDFIRNVIVGEFGGPEPSPFMLDALVAYMLEFDFLPNSKLNAQGQLTAKASAAATARRGAVPQALRANGRQIMRDLPRSIGQLPRPQIPQHRFGPAGIRWRTRRGIRYADVAGIQLYRALFSRRPPADAQERRRVVQQSLQVGAQIVRPDGPGGISQNRG